VALDGFVRVLRTEKRTSYIVLSLSAVAGTLSKENKEEGQQKKRTSPLFLFLLLLFLFLSRSLAWPLGIFNLQEGRTIKVEDNIWSLNILFSSLDCLTTTPTLSHHPTRLPKKDDQRIKGCKKKKSNTVAVPNTEGLKKESKGTQVPLTTTEGSSGQTQRNSMATAKRKKEGLKDGIDKGYRWYRRERNIQLESEGIQQGKHLCRARNTDARSERARPRMREVSLTGRGESHPVSGNARGKEPNYSFAQMLIEPGVDCQNLPSTDSLLIMFNPEANKDDMEEAGKDEKNRPPVWSSSTWFSG